MNVSHPDPPPRFLVAALAAAATPIAVLPALMLCSSTLTIDLDRWTCIVLAIVSVACGAALAAACWRSLPPTPSQFVCAHPRPGERVVRFAITLAAVLFAGFSFVALWQVVHSRPVIDWDGLYYHVPAMHAWARAGRIVWIESVPDIPFVNGYPMALEALGLWSVQVFGHDRWIEAGNLLTWPAGALGLALLAQRLGARGGWLWLAGAGIALIPAIMVSSATAYVDVGFFAACAAAFALTLWRLQGGSGRALAVVWATSLGLLMSIKGTGIPLGLLLIGAVTLRALCSDPRVAAHAVRSGAISLCIVLSIGGLWPLRALLHTGNPIHPIELRIGAKVLAEGYDAHSAADLAMPAELQALPAPLRAPATWLRPMRPVTLYDQTEGLGPLWTFAGWPALLGLLLIALRQRNAAALTLLGIATLWWIAQPATWWARFSLWILALGWPAATALAARISGAAAPVLRWLALVAVAVVLGLAASVCIPALEHERSWPQRHGFSSFAHAAGSDALDLRWPLLRDRAAFADALDQPRIGRTRVARVGTLFAGALAQPVGMRAIVVFSVEPASTLSERMQARGLDWLLWDESAVGAPSERALEQLVEEDRFDLGGSWMRLLRLQ